MDLLVSSIPIPNIQLQYFKEDGHKIFRIFSSDVDPLFEQLLLNKSIRAQVWLEREIRKQSGGLIKRSWVHSVDFSNKKPERLFTDDEYNYGGGDGWGWKGDIPPYTTTNGIVPTEFEITTDNINNNSLTIKFPVVDIFSNIIKSYGTGTYASDGDLSKDLAIISRGKAIYQLLRARIVINHKGKVIMGEPTEAIMIGIHKNGGIQKFNSKHIEEFIKIGRFI